MHQIPPVSPVLPLPAQQSAAPAVAAPGALQVGEVSVEVFPAVAQGVNQLDVIARNAFFFQHGGFVSQPRNAEFPVLTRDALKFFPNKSANEEGEIPLEQTSLVESDERFLVELRQVFHASVTPLTVQIADFIDRATHFHSCSVLPAQQSAAPAVPGAAL